MAVTVIGEDEAKRKKTSCVNCGALLQYTLADTTTEVVSDYGGGSDTYRRLVCPRCGERLTVPLY